MPKFTMADVKHAGSRVTEYHAPFKAEGTDIRNAFGVIVGKAIDEVHAVKFAAAPDMLAALTLAEKHIGSLCADVSEIDLPDWFADLATIRKAIEAAGGTVANTGGDRTKSTFFTMLASLRAFVSACGGNPPDWLRNEYATAEDAIAAAEGR